MALPKHILRWPLNTELELDMCIFVQQKLGFYGGVFHRMYFN